MRYIGIDVASEIHMVAALGDTGEVLLEPTPVNESARGYGRLKEALGSPEDAVVVFEATGHYWKNLAASLAAWGFAVVLLNPLRTRRFAESDLERTKTDAIDALSLARLGVEKRPRPTQLPDVVTDELRELVRHRDRIKQDFDDRVRQLHRAVDFIYPELHQHLRDLGSRKATKILSEYPTAKELAALKPKQLANLRYDGVHAVGVELATKIVEGAKVTVGAHQGAGYALQVRHFCEDLDLWRTRLSQLDGDIERAVEKHEIGKLLTTIDGIGPLTSARLVAEFGDFTRYEKGGAALAAHVGAVPALRHSGKSNPLRAGITHFGDAKLRAHLYMPTLSAVRHNAWLKHHYERLIAKGKLPKVALIACMRKLLHAIYSVATHRKPFVPKLPQPAEVPA